MFCDLDLIAQSVIFIYEHCLSKQNYHMFCDLDLNLYNLIMYIAWVSKQNYHMFCDLDLIAQSV